jgi:hypothetical protein
VSFAICFWLSLARCNLPLEPVLPLLRLPQRLLALLNLHLNALVMLLKMISLVWIANLPNSGVSSTLSRSERTLKRVLFLTSEYFFDFFLARW